MSLQEKFDLAVEIVQNLPKEGNFQPSNDLKLEFYAYYKQAKVGKCNTSRPGMLDFVGKAKWDSWDKLGAMSADEAMQGYVSGLKKMIDDNPPEGLDSASNERIAKFVQLMK